jgi:Rps23 Pro-64 3,4-dihydroxylase Tpa1-like proline 4-hydroxylase
MSKKKKKRKWNKKQEKTIIPNINQPKTSIPFTDKTDEYSEQINKKIVFVFKDYLHKECWLGNINKKQAKNLIDKLINTSTVRRNEIQKYSFIKRVYPCKENNEYSKLFCKDTFKQYESDFFEIICSDTNRVFWYFINNIFHIILIKDRHLKTDKK